MKPERVRMVTHGVEEEPSVGTGEIPMLFFGILAGLVFLGLLYLDRYAGGFHNRVYRPFPSHDDVARLQPMDPVAKERARGKALYTTYCLMCHQENGLGTAGQFPPLDGSEWVVGSVNRLIHIPQLGLNGPITVKGEPWNASMLAIGATLPDEDLAAILTYIRQAWSNKAGPVKPEQVKKVRADLAGRTDPIQGQDELNKIPE